MSGQQRPSGQFRRSESGSRHHGRTRSGGSTVSSAFYRRGSEMSTASFISDVNMAHDEVFSGPIPESLPTSQAGFAHYRQRAGSVASFAYYDDDQEESPEQSTWQFDEEEAVFDEPLVDEPTDESFSGNEDDRDLESGRPSPPRRKSSGLSRLSVEDPLLQRADSMGSHLTGMEGGRRNQKIYIASEDLTIVIAGFRNSPIGFAIYLLLCICTGGLVWLLLRWLPRWKVALVGRMSPIRDCHWTVVENQWGEMTINPITAEAFDHPLVTVFGVSENKKFRDYDEDADAPLGTLRTLTYRYIKFIYHPLKDKFVVNSSYKDPQWNDVKMMRQGLDSDDRDVKRQIFGDNMIEIEQKSIPALLFDEAFHPFYVFQIASMVLWSLDEYYYYATCIFIISAVSITITLVETRQTMKRLREISRFECDVRVLRNGFWRTISSAELVPGDVYEVSDPALGQFPADSLLLSGDAIVNESMLTGESVPVSKIPAVDEVLDKLELGANAVHPSVAKHFLFCGTKIVRARRPQDSDDNEAVALGVVLRTGFNTTKGALVRSMLFPKPSGFKFYRDSFRYIAVMAGIAGIGFIASFIQFVRLGLEWHLILVRALDLITIVVPPALPATLTIGTNFALSRLRKKQIFCISPQRVNVGGKLDLVCFDKTGTLTEDGLDVLGVRVVHRQTTSFSDLLTDAESVLPPANYERDPTLDYGVHKALLHAMATCHSLRVVDDALVGDPLDYKMFEFTGWLFEESGRKNPDEEGASNLSPSVARPPPGLEYEDDSNDPSSRVPTELGVLKSFEFVSNLRRASVIVRQFGSHEGDIYVKGAPEVMKEICRPETFPSDYEDLLGFYTHRGFRVIACATKHIERLNWVKVQKMQRTEAESDLDFVGFIIFENKLKDITTDIMDELKDANLRTVMCTGDNILTAISVARECHLIDRSAHCFVPHFAEGDSTIPKSRISWQSVDNSIYELDPVTLMPLPPPVDGDISLPYDMNNFQNYSLAVSGDAFRWIVQYGNEDLTRRMLTKGQVFARMSPDEKAELIEKFQSIDYCAAFCGDGANDCGALKAADVGISLSEAEASVAAPFTSRVFDISCVPEVIREGRAALVTSFSCFKYMSLYSAIQFTSVSFLYASASNLGDFQYLFIDLFLILPIAIFMGWTGPYPHLSTKKPTASLVSRKVLVPLLGQIVLCILVQAINYQAVIRQSWYLPPQLDKEKSNILNSQNTTLFLVSCFQYILSAVVISKGYPFRERMSHNLPFVATIIAANLFGVYMLFDPSEGFSAFMELTYVSTAFKLFILVLAAGGFACSWLGEDYVFPSLAKLIGSTKDRLFPQNKKKRKEYKLLAESMRL